MKPWPLAVDQFTLADKLRIGWWLVRGKQWTAGPAVRDYERLWEQYTGATHAIMVANGSVANELLARHRKEELEAAGQWPFSNEVIVPACTWVSSVSPWLREGFAPVWCDISANLCAPLTDIARLLAQDTAGRIKTVFYTTLLGQADYLVQLRNICEFHGARLLLDNCEASFSWTQEAFGFARQHFCAVATSSTSFYFSHPATTGTEGGMIFCHAEEDADWFRMMRNHGLSRGMPGKYRNPDAHPAFDFHYAGSNARSSDLQAYMGSLTFARSLAFARKRIELATLFYSALDPWKYDDVTHGRCSNPLMALPIVPKPTQRDSREHVSVRLDRLKIEHRPVVGGNLLRHTAFKKYGTAALFPRAQHLHDHGVYIGLNEAVDAEMVQELAEELNR